MKAPIMALALTLVVALVVIAALAETRGTAREHTNRLAGETSPYLLQHAHNPVDWYPWGAEAFEAARRQGKPIFLSIGYSTCHWCHVMAHESFEDEEVAGVMNEHFICIKVDREELPDVDEQYMLATQLMTQRGGWPNSVVLTPDGRPWFAGTYFPKDRFIPLLRELARVWREQRPQVLEQADRLSAAIRQVAGRSGPHRTPPITPQILDRAAQEFLSIYDARNGGFGTRPKFPPHGTLAVLMEAQTRTGDLDRLSAVTHTLDAMSRGGIYDHIGGGFHRYSTDARWFLPHFEKMLYDNAQLIRAYSDAYALTGAEDYKRIIAETFAWLEREMTDPAGGFYSALDADSEGEEGKFYVWTYDEVEAVLGPEDAPLFARTYNITREGTYHEEATGHPTGASIPCLATPLPDDGTTRGRLAAMRARMLEARSKRVRPHLDDKVLTGWNGLMIGALARAGRVLGEPSYIQAATAAAAFVLDNLRTPEGRLLRTWRKGQSKLPGYLDDYAFLIDGLLELHTATGEARHLDAARALAETMIGEFYDAEHGGFYSTSGDHDELLVRTKEVGAGGNIPSGNGIAADALLRLALLTGEDRYAELGADTLRHFGYLMWSQPHGSEALIVALSRCYGVAEQRPGLRLVERLAPRSRTQADADAGQSPVGVEAYASHRQVAPGGMLYVALRVRIDPGYHIYAPGVDPATRLSPAAVEVAGPEGLRVAEIRWPEPRATTDPVLGTEVLTLEGSPVVLIRLEVLGDAAEAAAEVSLRFKGQPCDDRACYPPVDHVLTIPVAIRRDAEPAPLRHAEVFAPFGLK